MSSERWRREHYGDPCQVDFTRVAIGAAEVAVERRCAAAFVALGNLIDAHGYDVDPDQTGAYNCRQIAGSSTWSSHAWAIAVDVNWNRNPRKRPLTTDLPDALVADAKALRTNDGAPVFRWGGDWSYPDPMHFEVIATPGQIATGIAGHTASTGDDEMLKNGDGGNGVAVFQRALMVWRDEALPEFGADGDFGDETEEWVKRYQSAAEIPQTGTIGGVTAALLSRYVSKSGGGGSGHDHPDGTVSESEVVARLKAHASNADAHHA